MAITRLDFKPLPSSGVIQPDRAPASAWALSYAFTYTTTAAADTANRSVDTHIKIQVFDAADNLKYTVDVYETYFVLVFPMGPGLLLFTWNQVPALEKIVGLRADGSAMSTLGLGTFGIDPAEDSGTSDREVIVDSRFYSGIFTEPLDVGDRFKIAFHNASAGFVTDKASLSIATQAEEGTPPGLFDARCGQQFHAMIDGRNTRVMRSRWIASPVPQMGAEWGLFDDSSPGLVTQVPLQHMRLWRRAGGGMYLFGHVASSYKILRSFDEAENWQEIMALTNSVAPLAVCPSPDGSTLFVYGTGTDKKAAFTILKNGKDGWVVSETGACGGENLPVSSVNSLEISDGGLLRLMATDSNKALLLFTSPDGKAYTQQAVQ